MELIKPSVEIITEPDLFKRIELAARTCYKSEDKIAPGSDMKLFKRLVASGHESTLEHSNIVVVCDVFACMQLRTALDDYENAVGLPAYIRRDTMHDGVFSGNLRAWRSLCKVCFNYPVLRHLFYLHPAFEDLHLEDYQPDASMKEAGFAAVIVEPDLAFGDRHNIITARFICDRGVSHELVRHRCLSFCVDGDTVLYSMGAKTWTVKQLYEWQNDPKRSGRLKLMHIRSCNEETGELVRNHIVQVVKTGAKECYELVTLHGRRLVCTGDHRILTPNGYKRLDELAVGDCVMSNGLPLLENPEWIRNYYIEQNHTRAETARAIGCCEATLYKAFKRFGIKKPWSDRPNRHAGHGVKGMHSDEAKAQIAERMTGAGNHRWVENPHDLTELGARIRARKACDAKCCAVCGASEDVEVHHIDKDPYNNAPANLEPLCPKHHRQRHYIGSNEAVFSDPIVSITPCGKREVYDVEMEAPYHNFVANGIVVHNCQESTRYVNYKEGAQFIEPWWWDSATHFDKETFKMDCRDAETAYARMMRTPYATPQRARAVLNNALKTEVVATGTVEMWKKLVLPLRLAQGAHPDIRRLMTLFCEQMNWKELTE